MGIDNHIKKIRVDQLRPGMYVHDLNCSWMDHPFVANRFEVRDYKRIDEIRALGVHELYIDIRKGLAIEPATTLAMEREASVHDLEALVDHGVELPSRVPLAEEIERARQLRKQATAMVRGLMTDLRMGKQIEMERVSPLVVDLADSVLRNPDALLPLVRLKSHDTYTFEHSVATCALMVSFARAMGLERTTIQEIATGALLHDVGKTMVDERIINKPGKLNDAEFDAIKHHVAHGIRILRDTSGISSLAIAVAGEHHERYDGSGYPDRLQGGQISQFGRMGAIVDVYDALTSNRAYRQAMSPTATLGRLLEWSKDQFDPALVQAFIRTLGIYPTGSLVKLASGRLAVVVEQHAEKSTRPRVKVIFHAGQQCYLPPEELDLAQAHCQDQIVGHENFSDWRIDPARWLPV